jgi:hypothetical protein
MVNSPHVFPAEGEFSYNHFPLFKHFKYTNLRHDTISFNMGEASLEFLSKAGDPEAQHLRIIMPLVKYFESDFDYEYTTFGFRRSGHLKFVANNTFLMADFSLSTTSKGHIYPQLINLHIDISRSEIYETSSWISQFFYR